LLLSKIDNDSYFEKQPIVLNDYLNKNLEFFREQAESKNLSVNTDFEEDTAINSNPVLSEILINNLFLNAIRHNILQGQITISTRANAITFSNTGQSTALNSEKLFNRFSKSDPSAQGNGLGLAIIKRIAEINKWEISYSFSAPNLHIFTLNF
jgi:signal transduction histidine kinase